MVDTTAQTLRIVAPWLITHGTNEGCSPSAVVMTKIDGYYWCIATVTTFGTHSLAHLVRSERAVCIRCCRCRLRVA